ncbi:hypothetical protein [Gimesia panareensis]|uniref:hypothetical protein n=1 Tax=Gimesia panareensis TaxID=2527978 RepID=UPI001187BB84|nr:hypothetical protein [Gimesia panareensis]QDU48243.1 hypothetical protein Pan110_05560 [Gimesia panareensis]
MSWLKSLKFKRASDLCSRDSSQTERRFRFGVRWNQTTKVIAGLIASVCSMMALISFFGSLEQPTVEDKALFEAESLAPDLGSSDELSQEFGLDAELPLQAVSDDDAGQPAIQTVAVEQAAGISESDSGVYHALGRDFGDRQTSGRVEQVSGAQPIYVPVRQSGGSQDASGSGAAWLTGEIEELEQLPTVRSMAVPPRNY